VESERHKVLRTSLQWKRREAEKTLFSKESAHNYIPVATKLISLVAHASKVRNIKLQWHPSNGSGDKAEKVFYSPSKAPLIIA
jgi:hypothetical protein